MHLHPKLHNFPASLPRGECEVLFPSVEAVLPKSAPQLERYVSLLSRFPFSPNPHSHHECLLQTLPLTRWIFPWRVMVLLLVWVFMVFRHCLQSKCKRFRLSKLISHLLVCSVSLSPKQSRLATLRDWLNSTLSLSDDISQHFYMSLSMRCCITIGGLPKDCIFESYNPDLVVSRSEWSYLKIILNTTTIPIVIQDQINPDHSDPH